MIFRLLARLNKMILPSFTRKGLDPARAKKWQLAILMWRYWVTSRALK